ncbi:MAG: class B sortase [Lachnospiraceae bacterium]|nr:class B sortase [Lachnospiraceae bacterium]
MDKNSKEQDLMTSEARTSTFSNVGVTEQNTVTVKVEKEGEDGGEETEERVLTILPKYQSLYKKNKNLIGWLTIEGTDINYPVMKSIHGNGEFYLDHDYNGKEDRNGTLFMDDNCDVIKPSENWLIYGHNMKSGKMFGNLTDYKNQAFYETHPTVKFDTIYETGVYKVIYAFESRVYEESEIAFKYYQFIDPASEAEFNSGIKEMEAASYIKSPYTVSYGDRLLMLSTCDYDEANGRFVVVCVRMEDE